jgi:phosphate transport system substrate-binding protein
MRKLLGIFVLGWFVSAGATAEARDEIRIVGSSTVYPFTSLVLEKMEGESGLEADLTSTGTGGGFLLFCTGSGDLWPDLTGASRPMKESERQRCAKNGVNDITEIKIGYDGIVVANAASAETVAFKKEDLFRALSDQTIVDGRVLDNPATTWKDVNSDFPATDIQVIGPPESSGTRDSFVAFVMQAGCQRVDGLEIILEEDQNAFCSTIRDDDVYIDGGEDDMVIVNMLAEDPSAFGIFGFSFTVDFPEMVKANPIDGVQPTVASIKDGTYPLARPLYIYVKNGRVAAVPKIKDFLVEYISEPTFGPDSYLAEHGLVPLTDEERAESMTKVKMLVGN